MTPVVAVAAVVRFLVELATLAVLAWWGWSAGGPVAAVLVPVAAALVWGTFCSPRAAIRLAYPAVLALQVLVLGSGVLGLLALGHPAWAGLLAVLAVSSGVVLAVDDHRNGSAWARSAR